MELVYINITPFKSGKPSPSPFFDAMLPRERLQIAFLMISQMIDDCVYGSDSSNLNLCDKLVIDYLMVIDITILCTNTVNLKL